MVRVANVNIPDSKRVGISLSYIYGIGRPLGFDICKKLNIDLNLKARDLTDEQLAVVRDYIRENLVVEGELRKEVSLNINRKKDIGCYAGVRHRKRLPVRGQNTHSNARTRKGRSLPIANKKKIS